MDQRIAKLEREVKQLDAGIQNEAERERALMAGRRKKESEIRYRERRKRTHRLIEIGAEVESVLGRPIPKEELPAFREYMKKAEDELGAFRVVNGRCSFLLP